LNGFEASAVEIKELADVFLRLGGPRTAESGGRASRSSDTHRAGYKLQKVECDIFVPTSAKSGTIECVHM
jgi:hypothetical protein